VVRRDDPSRRWRCSSRTPFCKPPIRGTGTVAPRLWHHTSPQMQREMKNARSFLRLSRQACLWPSPCPCRNKIRVPSEPPKKSPRSSKIRQASGRLWPSAHRPRPADGRAEQETARLRADRAWLKVVTVSALPGLGRQARRQCHGHLHCPTREQGSMTNTGLWEAC
jgi:hypothetical protein